MLKKEDAIKTQIEPYYCGKRCTMYYYKCTVCHSEIKYRAVELLRVSGLCKVCAARKSIKTLKARGIQPSNTKRPFERNFNNFKRLNVDKWVDLTYEEYLIFCSDDKCHYCFSKIQRSKNGTKFGCGYFLDRMDNSIGYTKSNLVNCCTRCNMGKRNLFSYEEWYGMTEFFRKKHDKI